MGSPGPTRTQADLADMIEMLLDKGVVVNADIVVTIGETKLLGVQVRAALASFETAAEYGLEFPEGTDMERVEEAAAGRSRRRVEGGSEEGDADEEATAVTVDAGPSDDAAEDADEDDGSVPSGPDRVAVRPQATTGDGDADDEEDDADG